MSTYQTIFRLVEEAIFVYQAPNPAAVAAHIRRKSNIKNVNHREIVKIMERVCTQYQNRERDGE